MAQDSRGNVEQEQLQIKLDEETNKKTEVLDKGEVLEIIFTESNRHYIVDQNGNVREEEWWTYTDENENNYITNGDTTLQIGDYILYDANSNEEQTYIAKAEKTGIETGEDQIFSSSFETKWRLLGVDNTSEGDYLMLVPETPIQSTNAKRFDFKRKYRLSIWNRRNRKYQ